MIKSSQNRTARHTHQGRRKFVKKAAAGLAGLSLSRWTPLELLKETPMGVVVHSYAFRWNSQYKSQKYPGFENAIQLMEHCHYLGAGGVQVGVNNWGTDFAGNVRAKREQLGLYLEGSIRLPRDREEAADFEQNIKNAKEAGVKVFRTVCLSGRRYETFHSLEEFQQFRQDALLSLQLAEPVVRKHKVRLALENHKDWRANELVELLKQIDSEWLGVTLDFGNSIALLEDPMEVVEALAPFVFTTHVKDMAVKEYAQGFLLSEVPLGMGFLDLARIFERCKQNNPRVTFNLEMITRDPLEIPCLETTYWTTFDTVGGSELAGTLRLVRQNEHQNELPTVSDLTADERLAVEEANVVLSLQYSNKYLENRTTEKK